MTGSGVPARRSLAGISLLELTVTLCLGVTLSAALVTLYLASKRSYVLDQQLARLHESGRHAIDSLGRDLAMAGLYGGVAPGSLQLGPVDAGSCASGWALDTRTPLRALGDYPGDTGATARPDFLACVAPANVKPGTDLLALKRTAGGAAILEGQLQPGLPRSSTRRWYLRLKAGADGHWQQRSSAELAAANVAADVSYWRAVSRIYFVRPYAVSPGDGIPALCAEDLSGSLLAVRCLVEGVQDLQLEFGLDTDGDGLVDRFADAAESLDLADALVARIYLLMRSTAPVPGHLDTDDYRLGSKIVNGAGDGYVRYVVQATVRLDARLHGLG
jgi:hypothetical protein